MFFSIFSKRERMVLEIAEKCVIRFNISAFTGFRFLQILLPDLKSKNCWRILSSWFGLDKKKLFSDFDENYRRIRTAWYGWNLRPISDEPPWCAQNRTTEGFIFNFYFYTLITLDIDIHQGKFEMKWVLATFSDFFKPLSYQFDEVNYDFC